MCKSMQTVQTVKPNFKNSSKDNKNSNEYNFYLAN